MIYGGADRILHTLLEFGIVRKNWHSDSARRVMSRPVRQKSQLPRKLPATGEIKKVRMLGEKTVEEIENWLLNQE